MRTVKVKYILSPFWFIKGSWKTEMARKMATHPNTIYNISREGKSHPRYGELLENIKKTYGEPVKIENV